MRSVPTAPQHFHSGQAVLGGPGKPGQHRRAAGADPGGQWLPVGVLNVCVADRRCPRSRRSAPRAHRAPLISALTVHASPVVLRSLFRSFTGDLICRYRQRAERAVRRALPLIPSSRSVRSRDGTAKCSAGCGGVFDHRADPSRVVTHVAGPVGIGAVVGDVLRPVFGVAPAICAVCGRSRRCLTAQHDTTSKGWGLLSGQNRGPQLATSGDFLMATDTPGRDGRSARLARAGHAPAPPRRPPTASQRG